MDKTSFDQGGQLCWARDWLATESPIAQVPVASLTRGDSLRLQGESKAQAALMVDAVDVPPIVVHQPTMRVIDGWRRVTAATVRHQDTIAVRFFNGTSQEAFVLAVTANITHGLPLSPKDRKAAAARILSMYPEWSDRTIASTAGLSNHTVAVIRQKCSAGQIAQLNRRLGRDGKTYPLTSNAGRQAAAELIRADQGTSVREVARQAGVSVGTVHNVRARLAHGVDPAVQKARAVCLPFSLARGQALFQRLRKNPSVSFNDKGRAMLDVLSRSLHVAQEAHDATRAAPEHCRDTVAEFATVVSDVWSRIAQDLRTQARTVQLATTFNDKAL